MENEYKTGGYIYVKKQAFDFWKTYIEFLTKGMIDVPMPNPAIEFLADVKAGKYDEISDEEYDELLNSSRTCKLLEEKTKSNGRRNCTGSSNSYEFKS